MASVQLRLDLGLVPAAPPAPDPAEDAWQAVDEKTREDLLDRLAALMAATLGKQEGCDE